jgi:hypothetical protein
MDVCFGGFVLMFRASYGKVIGRLWEGYGKVWFDLRRSSG